MHTKGEPPRIIRPTILEDGPEFDVYGDGLPEATFLRRGLDVSQREFEFMKEESFINSGEWAKAYMSNLGHEFGLPSLALRYGAADIAWFMANASLRCIFDDRHTRLEVEDGLTIRATAPEYYGFRHTSLDARAGTVAVMSFAEGERPKYFRGLRRSRNYTISQCLKLAAPEWQIRANKVDSAPKNLILALARDEVSVLDVGY